MKLIKRFSIIALFLAALQFYACEEIPSEVIDKDFNSFSILEFQSPNSFTYSAADSNITASIKIDNTSYLREVYMNILSKDGDKKVAEKVIMYDNGDMGMNRDTKANDGIYTAYAPMKKSFSSGDYNLQIYVTNNSGVTKKIISKQFYFDNSQNNAAPIIADVVLAASVVRGETFTFSVKASDPNGYDDLQYVYFKLYRPDNSMVDPGNGLGFFVMNDLGNKDVFGDEMAGDGIFSFKNSFSSTTTLGTWRFEFQAKDRNGALSNLISQNMEVK
ncbi:hypothetical protein APF79_11380 [bacterium BRH_c32]|nr:MAG: hypothetical protein APF79_11380 [bacterium BRH_c32]